jgi:hypothetical protein
MSLPRVQHGRVGLEIVAAARSIMQPDRPGILSFAILDVKA